MPIWNEIVGSMPKSRVEEDSIVQATFYIRRPAMDVKLVALLRTLAWKNAAMFGGVPILELDLADVSAGGPLFKCAFDEPIPNEEGDDHDGDDYDSDNDNDEDDDVPSVQMPPLPKAQVGDKVFCGGTQTWFTVVKLNPKWSIIKVLPALRPNLLPLAHAPLCSTECAGAARLTSK